MCCYCTNAILSSTRVPSCAVSELLRAIATIQMYRIVLSSKGLDGSYKYARVRACVYRDRRSWTLIRKGNSRYIRIFVHSFVGPY